MPRSIKLPRPSCQNEHCDKPVAPIRYHYTGSERVAATWRKFCSSCHKKSWHPYCNYRKDYCENIDGRLGFVCTTNVVWEGMLDVDHIDGNPEHNEEENLQTLCKCCHAYKSYESKDYLSPGRKALGITY